MDTGNKEWVCFNDNSLSVMDANEIKGAPTAYLLFYVRKDVQGRSIDDLFGPAGPVYFNQGKNTKTAPSGAGSSVGGSTPSTPNRKATNA